MKHLTILSVSAAAIIFAGAHFQNRLNNIYSDAKKTERVIAVQVKEAKTATDSLMVSSGTSATMKVAKKAEHTTFKLIGRLVQSVF